VTAYPGATQTSKVAKIRPDNPTPLGQQRKLIASKIAGTWKAGSPNIALCWSFFDWQTDRRKTLVPRSAQINLWEKGYGPPL
jgi:hypothetical protein